MNKTKALSEVLIYIERVEAAPRFNGHAVLLNRLRFLYDRVDNYKPEITLNKFCVQKAKRIFDDQRRLLNVTR